MRFRNVFRHSGFNVVVSVLRYAGFHVRYCADGVTLGSPGYGDDVTHQFGYGRYRGGYGPGTYTRRACDCLPWQQILVAMVVATVAVDHGYQSFQ